MIHSFAIPDYMNGGIPGARAYSSMQGRELKAFKVQGLGVRV
jgi:hypothetical protein